MKKTLTILMIMLCTIIVLTGNVFAGAVSIKASKSSVTVGQNISVTVSFGGKVSAAQFKLDYDKSKFDYVSCSTGTFGTGTNTYVYVNYEDVEDLGSVTLTFKAKSTGSANFTIGGVVLSGSASISNSTATVKVNAATSSTTKKPTTTKANNNSNKDQEQQPEEVDKTTLDGLKMALAQLVEADYTEESWKALQDAINVAEEASSNDKFNEVKDKLTVDSLVKAPFEKEELNKVLRDLIGKVEKDYTEESWKALQELITEAEEADLKSKYDAVKTKLSVNSLILDEKDFMEVLLDDSCGHVRIMFGLAAACLILLIINILLATGYSRAKKEVLFGRIKG